MSQRWRYEVCGTMVEGFFDGFTDRGGTDVTYRFRRDDGTLDLVSGQRLREARNIQKEYLARKEKE